MNDKNRNHLSVFHEDGLVSALEALLFTSDKPLSPEDIAKVLDVTPKDVEQAATSLENHLSIGEHGVILRRVRTGYELVAHPRWHNLIQRFRENRNRLQLSRSLLETLAIIAYKQPLTVPEITAMRGVDASRACKTLLHLDLVRVVGRKKAPGRPRLLGTTPSFLTLLGLNSLEDLLPWETFVDDNESEVPFDDR